MTLTITCRNCKRVVTNPAEPCEWCGCTEQTKSYSFVVADEVRADDRVEWVARSPNAAPARRRELEAALADIEADVAAGDVGRARTSTKRALEAIHELDDCRRKRHEWSLAGWDADALGVWCGHVGARNAVHHDSTDSVVALYNEPPQETRLRWDLPAGAIAKLRWPDQRQAYNARLAGQPVLPMLRVLVADVAAVIPD